MERAGKEAWRKGVVWFSAVAIAVFLAVRLSGFAQYYISPIKRFLAAQGDYEQLRRFTLHAKVAADLRKVLPPGACVETSFPKDEVDLKAIVVKYYLYPWKVIDKWPSLFNQSPGPCQGNFYIDFAGTFQPPDHAGLARRDINGVKVFALDKSRDFTDDKAPAYPRGSILFRAFVFNLWMLLVGALACCIVPVRRYLGGLWGMLSVSYLSGFVLVTLTIWALLMSGLSLSRGLVIAVLSVINVGFLVALAAQNARARRAGTALSASKDPSGPGKGAVREGRVAAFDKFIAGAGLLAIAFFVLTVIAVPVNVWDEMHIWLLKSKMYFIGKALAFDYTVDTNNYYPVLWSLNIAAQYAFIGGMYDEAAKWTSAVVLVSFLGMLYQTARYLGLAPRFAWAAVLIFLVGFPYWTMVTALTENIYLALISLALFFALRYFIDRDRACGIFLWLALLGVSTVKFEGASIALFLVLAHVISGRGRSRAELSGDIKRAAPFLALLFLPSLWQMWLRTQGIPFTIYHFQTGFSVEKVLLILQMIGATVLSLPNLLVVAVVFLPLLFLGRERPWTRAERLLLAVCVMLVAFSFSAGAYWAEKELAAYYPEVLMRLFSRATPFLVLLWASRSLVDAGKES